MPQTCPACQGDGVTTKKTVENDLDENGNQVARTREYTSACTTCTGTGEVS
jgi:Fe-S cluster biogenesis protein NfuA